MDQYDVVYTILGFLNCVDLMRTKVVNKLFYCTSRENWKRLCKINPLKRSFEKRSPLMNNLLFGYETVFQIVGKFYSLLFIDENYVIVCSATRKISRFCIQVFSIKQHKLIFYHSSKNEPTAAQLNYPFLLIVLGHIEIFNLNYRHHLITTFEINDNKWLYQHYYLTMKTSISHKSITLTKYNLNYGSDIKKLVVTKTFRFAKTDKICSTILVQERFLFLGTECGSIFYIDVSKNDPNLIDMGIKNDQKIDQFALSMEGNVIAKTSYSFVWMKQEQDFYVIANTLHCSYLGYQCRMHFLEEIMTAQTYSWIIVWDFRNNQHDKFFNTSYEFIKNSYFLDRENIFELKRKTFMHRSKNDIDGCTIFDVIYEKTENSINFYDLITSEKVKSFNHQVNILKERWFFWYENNKLFFVV